MYFDNAIPLLRKRSRVASTNHLLFQPVEQIKHCLDCGEKLLGRSDKKFCNDFCRNAYNNKLNSDTNNLVRNINNLLRKNRRILHDLLENNSKQTIKKEDLLSLGFDLKFYTHMQHNPKGPAFYCYEYGYQMDDKEMVKIIGPRVKPQLDS